jgi:signal transduction histidine kinase
MGSRGDIIARAGATGALVQAMDWAATPLGPMSSWPARVVAAVELALSSGFPSAVMLGRDPSSARVLYNDPFISFLGPKHPAAMGRRAREVWPEAWDFVEWALRQAWQTGRPVTGKDLLLRIERDASLAEIHATMSFSPLWDDEGAACGARICAIETTAAVLAERRERALRILAETLGEAQTEGDLCRAVAAALSTAAKDVPFALFYTLDAARRRASLAAAAGVDTTAPNLAREVDLGAGAACPWDLAQVVSTGETRVVAATAVRPCAMVALAGAPRWAAVTPVSASPRDAPLGVLVVGLHPAQVLDAAYAAFVKRVAHEIATVLVNVRSLQEARLRAEALLEIDRAKTMFLTHAGHELRQPLTLVLGPIEDLLTSAEPLTEAQQRLLRCARRNALGLLRQASALLDFARVDAGRAGVTFEPTDLAGLTREIAQAFAPAAARAGLHLAIDCPPAPERVFVARDLWERIVLNLLTNAVKFTFAGRIAVRLRFGPANAELTVEDTGTGIPKEALPHVFERFYRVPRARARTPDGMGVGLAVVKELVELHKGSIQVRSAPGEGTTFVVEIPRGAAHLPEHRVQASPSPEVGPRDVPSIVEASLPWLGAPQVPDPAEAWPAEPDPTPAAPGERSGGRILVVEDSAEMRDYLATLLGATYEVEVVSSGAAAIAIVRDRPPDLVLSDVVMPEVDGLDLLRALREDPATRPIPVMLLSARGTAEATLGALGAGADDYLIKPFSPRELRARVRTHLELSRARREAAESRLKDVFLGLASHELRTPLTCLKLNVQLVHHHLAGLDTRLAERVAGLHHSVDRMTRLVDEMLSVAAISAGQLPLRLARCDLADLCRGIAAEQAQVAQRALDLAVPDGPVLVTADEDRLGQVLSNLVTNAFKYSPPERAVRVTLAVGDAEATVTVRDEGPGIPEEALPHVFERFYRVPGIQVRAGSYVGLGVGLYLSKAIVEQHHGRIWLDSTVGEGSAFSFALPLAA